MTAEASEAREIYSSDSNPELVLPVPRGLSFEPDPFVSMKPPPQSDPMDESILAIIAEALRWKGVPYAYGGSSMTVSDCSGYVGAVLARATGKGKIFPRSSGDYAVFGDKVTDSISPGDILVFSRNGVIYHVGIALSKNTFIHSASEGERTGVIISSLDDGMWRSRLAGIRRLSSGK
ncbi:MAG: C40 family peptidase [Rectinemataceae bacterium]|nr:C40 family peptidase [Rectinemataceae bacterium]